MYTLIRGKISKELGVKTQTYTRLEYIKALDIIKRDYEYDIPEEYKTD